MSLNFQFYKSLIQRMLQMSGLEFTTVKKQNISKEKIKDTYYLIMATNHLIFFFLTSAAIYNRINHREDYFYFIRSISSVGAFCIRIYYIFIKKMELGNILELLNNSYSQEDIKNYNLQPYIKVLRLVSSYCVVSCIAIVLLAITAPLVIWIFSGKLTFLNFTPFEEAFASMPQIYPLIWLWSNLLFLYMMCTSIGLTYFLTCCDFGELINKI